MDLASIFHRSAFTDCYALDHNTVVVNLRTGHDVTNVTIFHRDPFAGGDQTEPLVMEPKWELQHHRIWSIQLQPEYKREQYYFRISDAEQTVFLFGDGFCTPEEEKDPARMRQYFKYPWLNPDDVFTPPEWLSDTVWYQIMPDRFRKGSEAKKRFPLCQWDSKRKITYRDFYGGDLQGITRKLPYLKELGVTGIYMTPIFLSDTNHKYNTFDYTQIDPDFGTEGDLKTLVRTAHDMGIRVMLDAVFNHCGSQFSQWQDVVKNGPDSPYWDWFFVHQWPIPQEGWDTLDKRFYSFSFTTSMPKLNTNNPEVRKFCIDLCKKWITQWDIDGIRFDVGDEVSHRFLKEMNRELKAVKPDVFLLGELWHDSVQWLQGDEYDATMNYPFLISLQNFWIGEQRAKDLMYAMNRCYTMYPQQLSTILFNFLDTHDTVRAVTRCGGLDAFYQQLTMLMTMPGSPCIYYGTEIALEGGHDPDCRRPMPWKDIDAGKFDSQIQDCKDLIRIRRECPETRGDRVVWHNSSIPRLIHYSRPGEKNKTMLSVYLNADKVPAGIKLSGKLLFSRKLKDGILSPGGIAIIRKER